MIPAGLPTISSAPAPSTVTSPTVPVPRSVPPPVRFTDAVGRVAARCARCTPKSLEMVPVNELDPPKSSVLADWPLFIVTEPLPWRPPLICTDSIPGFAIVSVWPSDIDGRVRTSEMCRRSR